LDFSTFFGLNQKNSQLEAQIYEILNILKWDKG